MKSLIPGLLILVLTSSLQAAERVHLFAASSLATAMDRLATQYQTRTGIRVVTTYAASSALARQIYQGAPADIYLSANQRWMDYLQQQKMIQPQSRKTLLHNTLVLIQPATAQPPGGTISQLTNDWPLMETLADRRLALANPDHVPAGIYAKEALTTLNHWPRIRRNLARSHNVRGALALVEQGEAPMGIVYRTDALASQKVSIIADIPDNSHTSIDYPIALIRDAHATAADFYHYLNSPEAAAVFKAQGFRVPAVAQE